MQWGRLGRTLWSRASTPATAAARACPATRPGAHRTSPAAVAVGMRAGDVGRTDPVLERAAACMWVSLPAQAEGRARSCCTVRSCFMPSTLYIALADASQSEVRLVVLSVYSAAVCGRQEVICAPCCRRQEASAQI